MIQSLALKNFQSHKDTLIKFDPGVNVIVGSTDSGKSAIIRALRWLVWNRPIGDKMRSNWGGETEVIIDDELGRTKDEYFIRGGDEYGPSSFKAFGTWDGFNIVPERLVWAESSHVGGDLNLAF